MFNGIVESVGLVQAITIENECKHFTIVPRQPLNDLQINDSIAVNGVCLTITDMGENQLHLTLVPETLRLTNLNLLNSNSIVNLERAIQFNSRMSGHYVQGHVDGIGEIISLENEGEAKLCTIRVPRKLMRYIVNKGYITLDGMSITVISASTDCFTVTFIPHTQHITIVNSYHVGTLINIEVDILGKYVEKIMGANQYANCN